MSSILNGSGIYCYGLPIMIYIRPNGVSIYPDDFITDIIDLNHETSIKAFRDLVMNKKNPPLDDYQILDIFRKNGLKNTANYIHALI